MRYLFRDGSNSDCRFPGQSTRIGHVVESYIISALLLKYEMGRIILLNETTKFICTFNVIFKIWRWLFRQAQSINIFDIDKYYNISLIIQSKSCMCELNLQFRVNFEKQSIYLSLFRHKLHLIDDGTHSFKTRISIIIIWGHLACL